MIDYIAPYPVLLIVLAIGAAIVASRKPIMDHAEGVAARVSPDRLTRGVVRTVARFAVFMCESCRRRSRSPRAPAPGRDRRAIGAA